MKWRRSIAIFFMAVFLLAPGRATAQDMVVGVNVVNPMRASVADQNVPDSQEGSVELEECVSQWPGHPDHILIQKGVCETQGYRRLRSAGFVFSAAQPHTQPLYRCYSDSEKSHFAANRDDCDGMGKREALLGYDLKQ